MDKHPTLKQVIEQHLLLVGYTPNYFEPRLMDSPIDGFPGNLMENVRECLEEGL